MRAIIENRKLNTENHQLQSFINNLQVDGTYTFDEEIVKASFRHLPYNMRNADLTMVSGAYKNGQIACYDKNGDIIDVGFSRSSINYGFDGDLNPISNPINTPNFDNFYYRRFVGGYTIENEIVNKRPSNTVINQTWQGGTFSFDGVVSRMTGNNTSIQMAGGIQHNRIAYSDCRLFVSGKNLQPNSTMTLVPMGVGSAYINFDLTTGAILSIQNGSGDVQIKQPLTKFGDWWIIEFNLGYVDSQTGMDMYIESPTTITNSEYFEFCHYARLEDGTAMFANNNSFCNRSADIISPIYITNDSLVHIKTVKDIKEFIFDAHDNLYINDYISNDKLICFAIKHLDGFSIF